MLNQLPKIKNSTSVNKVKKRLGRGLSSGKGKTSARGQKGQKARGKIPAANVGGGLIWFKKFPYVRGWSRHGGNPARSPKMVVVKTSQLNTLPKDFVVNVVNLAGKGLVKEKEANKKGVKVLVDTKLEQSLVVQLPVSSKAKELIEKAGGRVEI